MVASVAGFPVKLAAVELIRKGAGLRNFVWLDSQDIGGVDKELLRSCSVWLLGVQREANEVKRVLSNIPAGIAKPSASDVATLERGQFFACWGRHVVKTYVQPVWMSDYSAQDIATGVRDLDEFREEYRRDMNEAGNKRTDEITLQVLAKNAGVDLDAGMPATREYIEGLKDHAAQLEQEKDDMTPDQERKLDRVIELLSSPEARRDAESASAAGLPPRSEPERALAPQTQVLHAGFELDEEALYQAFKARLMKEAPAILKVLAVKPELRVVETSPTIELDGKTLRGRLARMIADGFFDDPKAGNAAFNELKRVGFKTAKPNVYRECDALAEMGFLTKESDGFHAVADMKRSIKRSAA